MKYILQISIIFCFIVCCNQYDNDYFVKFHDGETLVKSEINYPTSIRKNPLNNDFVIITGQKNIQIFNPNSNTFIDKLAENGRSPEKLGMIYDIDFSITRKELFLLDVVNNKIMIYDLENYHFKRSIPIHDFNSYGFEYIEKSNKIYLTAIPKSNTHYLIYCYDLVTEKMEPIVESKVTLENQDIMYSHVCRMTSWDSNIALLAAGKMEDMFLYIYNCENRDFKRFSYSAISCHDPEYRVMFFEYAGNNKFVIGSDLKDLYTINIETLKMNKVNLTFSQETYNTEYDSLKKNLVLKNAKIGNRTFKEFYTQYDLFFNPELKEVYAIINMTKINIFKYDF